jgi:peptidyl-prolyl cis-trans isomerase C
MRRVVGAPALALATAMALGSCHKEAPAAPQGDGGIASGSASGAESLSRAQAAQVLARVGDHTITVGDYVAALQTMDAFDRVRYSAPARRRELLGEMIDVMLLADEAREKGYDKDPLAQEEVRQILRDALLKKARESAPAPNDIPEAEVRAYFDDHRADFHDPERRRVSAIVLLTQGAGAAVLAEATHATAPQWGELVRVKSVDAQAKSDVPIDLAGDFGFVSPPGDSRGVNARVPAEVRAAVFEVANVGEVFPRVVAAGGRFYVVKLEGRAPEHDRSFEDAERSIRVRLAQEKEGASEAALLADLHKQYPVQIDEAALSQVKVRLQPSDAGAD